MLDLWSSRWTICEETGSSRWLLSSALLQWFWGFETKSSPKYGDPLHLLLGHCSSQLMMSSHDLCMPSQPWKLLFWIHLMKWLAVLVTDAPAKRSTTVCPLSKSDKSPILQYFHSNCYYTHSVIHSHWHYTAQTQHKIMRETHSQSSYSGANTNSVIPISYNRTN